MPTVCTTRIAAAQLRRLHLLWREWTHKLALPPERDRALRHYYVALFSEGRAASTLELSREDAARVVAWLARLSHPASARQNQAAGTAGRRGFPERRRIAPNSAAWRALWGYAAALDMDRGRLSRFIREHYAGVGLRGVSDIRTMADLNRVLWGLKAMLRRGPDKGKSSWRKAA
jgi:hypothetical protein